MLHFSQSIAIKVLRFSTQKCKYLEINRLYWKFLEIHSVFEMHSNLILKTCFLSVLRKHFWLWKTFFFNECPDLEFYRVKRIQICCDIEIGTVENKVGGYEQCHIYSNGKCYFFGFLKKGKPSSTLAYRSTECER